MQRSTAAAAAYAASKKDSSAIEISPAVEDKIRRIYDCLEGTSHSAYTRLEPGNTVALSKNQLRKKLETIYEELLRSGFQPRDIERALGALEPVNISSENAFDWLCFNLHTSELPERFSSSFNGANEAKGTISVRVAPPQREPLPPEVPAGGGGASAEEAPTEVEADAPPTAPDSDPAATPRGEEPADSGGDRGGKQAAEHAARKAMILRYVEEEYDGSSSETDPDDAIEDFELSLWADPREVERRKRERSNARVPPEVRRQQISEEWRMAKKEAAAAKSARDKARQKSAGEIIRDLKREMDSLGITEADLEEAPPEEPGARAGSEKPSGSEAAEGADGSGEPPPAAGGGAGGSSSDSDDSGCIDLFGGEEEVAEAFGSTAEELAKGSGSGPRKQEITDPWLLSQGYDTVHVKGKAGKKAPPGQARQQAAKHLPSTLLQRHCHRMGWAAPRFEKAGYTRGDQLRYRAVLEPGPGAPKARGKAARERSAFGRYELREVEDGWATVQEAQNAVAAYALSFLMPDQPLHLVVCEPYAALLERWQEEGRTDRETSSRQEEKDAVIEQLLEKKMAELSAEGAPDRGGAGEGAAAPLAGAAAPAARRRKDLSKVKRVSDQMAEEQRRWLESEEGRGWQSRRANLPAWQIRSSVCAALDKGDVLVVSGDTGCGKTTQVPQFILESEVARGNGGSAHVVCTQPRRIAAISVAERVAAERGEPPPGQRGSRVGYHVQLDAATTPDTRLTFCTTGILLRRLIHDPNLMAVSHVIVDEVHERTLQGDFLLSLLKRLVRSRRELEVPLKVVMMSATVDAERLCMYFGGAPMLHAEGRTFPVQRLFLEDCYEMLGYRLDPDSPAALRGDPRLRDKRGVEKAVSSSQAKIIGAGWGDDAEEVALNPNYDPEYFSGLSEAARKNLRRLDESRIDFDLVEAVVAFIDENQSDGAILVFLPGFGEIAEMHGRLTASFRFRGEARDWILPLHSTVAPADQRRAFAVPPKGIRKVVLATNIAETSLTIEDVVYVVDSGRLKERRYDAARGMSLLAEDFVSKASAKQRQGRAGRVREGVCFSLFTSLRHEKMREFQVPEMHRVPLEEIVLQIHLLGLGRAADFLSGVIDPPKQKVVDAAIASLTSIGALSPERECLTPLGHHIAQLPVDGRIGKLLLIGAVLGCLSPVLTIAACLSYKSPFQGQYGNQEAMEKARAAMAAAGSGTIAAKQQSDHLVMVAAYDGWAEAFARGGPGAAAAFARKRFLSPQTLQMLADMRGQFATMLAEIGFLDGGGARGRGRASAGSCWADDPEAPWNKHRARPAVVKAALTAALHPFVAVMDDSAGRSRRPAWHDGQQEVALHPQSVNHPLVASAFNTPYVVYLEKMSTSRVFLRDCSVVSPVALLLFGGDIQVSHEAGYVTVSGWIRVRAGGKAAAVARRARAAIRSMLEQHIRRSAGAASAPAASYEREIVSAVVALLTDNERGG